MQKFFTSDILIFILRIPRSFELFKVKESLGVSFSKLHEEGIDAVVAKVEIAYKSSLSGDDKFVVQLRTVKEGIKYVFHEDILRLPERTLCIRAKIETVIVEQGRLSKGDRLG